VHQDREVPKPIIINQTTKTPFLILSFVTVTLNSTVLPICTS